MKLMYIWTAGYKVLKEGGFNFSREFNFDYDSKNNTIIIQKNRYYNQLKYDNNIDLCCIVGKNGSGKTTLLELIGEFEGYNCNNFSEVKIKYPKNYVAIYLLENSSENPIILIYTSNEIYTIKDFENNIELNLNLQNNMLKLGNKIYEIELNSERDLKLLFTTYTYYQGHFSESNYGVKGNWTNNLSTNYLIEKAENVSEYKSNEDLKQLNFIVGSNDLDSNEKKPLIYQSIKSRLKKVKILISKEKLKKAIDELYEKDFPEDSSDNQDEKKLALETIYSKMKQIIDKKFEANEFKDYFFKSMIVSLFLEYKKELTIKMGYNEFWEKIEDNLTIVDLYEELIHITKNKNKMKVKEINEKLTNFEVNEITITKNNEIEIEIEIEIKKIEDLLRHYFSFSPNKKNKMINISWLGISNGEYEFLKLYSRFYDIGYDVKKYSQMTDKDKKKIEKTQPSIPINESTDIALVLFDEIDLSFHPEWQRKLIQEIKFMNKCFDHKEGKKIQQIIMTTHSPIILSDFPAESVIFLDDGKSVKPKIETFGQNIHTLFKSGFFLESTIGEFASEKIKEVINYLEQKTKAELEDDLNRKKEIEYIISIIGEPIIKRKLELMYKEIFPENIEDYKMKIKKLEEEKQNLLKSKIGDKND